MAVYLKFKKSQGFIGFCRPAQERFGVRRHDKGAPRHWILEIHFVDRERQIGGFFEELLTVPTS
jgi:hypothetical protein